MHEQHRYCGTRAITPRHKLSELQTAPSTALHPNTPVPVSNLTQGLAVKPHVAGRSETGRASKKALELLVSVEHSSLSRPQQ